MIYFDFLNQCQFNLIKKKEFFQQISNSFLNFFKKRSHDLINKKFLEKTIVLILTNEAFKSNAYQDISDEIEIENPFLF